MAANPTKFFNHDDDDSGAGGGGGGGDDEAKRDKVSTSRRFKYRICSLAKSYLFAVSRYPVFRADFIRREIDQPETPEHELREYQSVALNRDKLKLAISLLILIIYCIKNSLVPIRTFQLFDYSTHTKAKLQFVGRNESSQQHQQQHHSPSSNQNRWFRYACMISNCTHFSAEPTGGGGGGGPGTSSSSSSSSLEADLELLPVFSICEPSLDRAYSPITKLDSFGLLTYSNSSFGMLLLGIWLPLQQLLYPAPNEVIMFIAAPVVTSRLMLRRARALYLDFSISFHNYCLNPSRRRLHSKLDQIEAQSVRSQPKYYENICHFHKVREQLERRTRRLLPALIGSSPAGSQTSSSAASPASSFMLADRKLLAKNNNNNGDDDGDNDEQAAAARRVDAIVEDCLPTVRTKWWRNQLVDGTSHVLVFAFMFVAIFCSMGLIYIRALVNIKRVTLHEFTSQMDRQNCVIDLWQEHYGAETDFRGPQELVKRIRLDEIDLDWTFTSVVQTVLLNIIPFFSAAIMFVYYCVTVDEFNCWLNEVRLHLLASISLSVFMHKSDLHEFNLTGEATLFKMTNLKRLYSSQTRLLVFLFNWAHYGGKSSWSVLDSKANDKNRLNHFWSVLRSHYGTALAENNTANARRSQPQPRPQPPPPPPLATTTSCKFSCKKLSDDHVMENLEKIYINYRLFVDHVHHSVSGILRQLIVITYGFDYGSLLVLVVISRRFNDFQTEPLFVVFFALLTANTVIVLAANFHSNSKKIEPLIWSLVAQMAPFEEVRMRHLRELWFKQAQALAIEDGIAFKVFGVRMTYVSCLQLLIGTSTLILIIYRYQQSSW